VPGQPFEGLLFASIDFLRIESSTVADGWRIHQAQQRARPDVLPRTAPDHPGPAHRRKLSARVASVSA
jgi:hypothetical protein